MAIESETFDRSDDLLLASLLFVAGGGVVLVGASTVSVVGFTAALVAGGSLTSGISGLGFWLGLKLATPLGAGPAQRDEVVAAFVESRAITKNAFDPFDFAVQTILNEMKLGTIPDPIFDVGVSDEIPKDPSTPSESLWKYSGDLGKSIIKAGDTILSRRAPSHEKVVTNDSNPMPISDSKNTPSYGAPRAGKDSSMIDPPSNASLFDTTSQFEHPMCEPGIPIEHP